MIIELEVNGARVIISGENLTVNVSEDAAVSQTEIPQGDLPSGNQIKAFRQSLGLGQVEFAKLLGIRNQSVVCRWERGVTQPNGSSALALVRLMERGAE